MTTRSPDATVNWKAVNRFKLHCCGTPLEVSFGETSDIKRVVPLVVDGVPRCAYCWRYSPHHAMAAARVHADTLREGLVAEKLISP